MGLGDEIMVTGLVRRMQQTDPRKVRVVYERPRWSEVWDYNPRIARPQDLEKAKESDFQVLFGRVGGLRPYVQAKSQVRWTWKDCPPEVGELYFSHEERNFSKCHAPQVVLEPNCKRGASPNKDWGWARWTALAGLMQAAGLEPVQLGPPGTKCLPGVKLIETDSFRRAAAVLSRAKAAVLHEGGLHHAAAALGIPSVVIFGGFISPRQTGYDRQVNLFTGGEPCGWRTPCGHCAEAMSRIEPQMVFEQLTQLVTRDEGRGTRAEGSANA